MVPAVAAPLMPNSQHALWLTVPVIFLHYTHFGVAMAGLQLITPNRMRAQVSALMLFMTNFFGLAFGGSVVAYVTDFVFQDDLSLRYSLAIVAAIFYPVAAIVIGLGVKVLFACNLIKAVLNAEANKWPPRQYFTRLSRC